jgi:hypothetical protein
MVDDRRRDPSALRREQVTIEAALTEAWLDRVAGIDE